MMVNKPCWRARTQTRQRQNFAPSYALPMKHGPVSRERDYVHEQIIRTL